MKYNVYITNVFTKEYFFSTDHCQELDDEENWVPVSALKAIPAIRKNLARQGYVEVANPDPAYAVKEKRDGK